MRDRFDPADSAKSRGRIARLFDMITLAAFVVALLTTAAAALYLGPAQAKDRLGCGLVDLVNRSLDLNQPCYAAGRAP